MRILVVTQMWPGPRDPDLGAFVAQVARELERQGHEVAVAGIDHRGSSPAKYARLALTAVARARAWGPDVVHAHFLFPAGFIGLLAARVAGAPLVLTAHGQDVRNVGAIPGVRALTRLTTARARGIIAVSDHLRRELVSRLPGLAGRVEVIDSGVDTRRFAPRDGAEARRRLGVRGPGPFLLFVGGLTERKNVVALADAFARLGEGQLLVVGDGPLRAELEGRPAVELAGRVPHDAVAEWIAAGDVLCLPSLIEPFGQVLLEAMAGARSVMATRVGGPPEFVAPGAGVLVDPASVDAIEAGLRAALALPRPNPAAREAAGAHDVRRQARRIGAVLARAARADR